MVREPLEVARTDEVAVIVSPIFAYPNGLRFDVNAVPRTAPEDPEAFFYAFRGDPEQQLRLAVEYPDGSTAASFRRSSVPDPHSGNPPEQPVLFAGSAHGGYAPKLLCWLWPLPEDGLDFVIEWPHQGIPATHAGLDGAAVRQAASEARDVWD
jgi:hypothetical protein